MKCSPYLIFPGLLYSLPDGVRAFGYTYHKHKFDKVLPKTQIACTIADDIIKIKYHHPILGVVRTP